MRICCLVYSAMFCLCSMTLAAMSQEALDLEANKIRKSRLAQNDAIASGDIDLAASVWTEDISLRRGLGGVTLGKDAYRALFQPSLAQNHLIYIRDPEFIEVSPDWPLAYESGTWTARYSADDSIAFTGRYSAQWVKREDVWLIRSEIFVALACHDTVNTWNALP